MPDWLKNKKAPFGAHLIQILLSADEAFRP